jgi:predicted sugar kinase
METLQQTLLERVDTLIESSKSDEPFLFTTPHTVAIAELVARADGLEQAVRELTAEVQRHYAAGV